jgi:membrane protein DedA with SNARE-associated domain
MLTEFFLAATTAHQWIQARLQNGSYLVLFGLLFCCGLGLPLPEDIPLLIAGALVATGKMKLAFAAICAWCGIIGGDIVLYHLGKVFGLEIRRVRLIGRHLSEKRLEQVHRMFERWGVWVVAVGRMFAGIRGAMVVVAGVTRFTFWKFLIADGLAAIVSGGLFLFLGYAFGRNMDTLRRRVEQGKEWTLIGALAIGVGIGIWIIIRRRMKRRSNEESASVPVTSNHAEAPSGSADH